MSRTFTLVAAGDVDGPTEVGAIDAPEDRDPGGPARRPGRDRAGRDGPVDLVTAALTGDEAALDAVLARWIPQLYAWCHRLGAPDPQGAAHEVVLLLLRRLNRVRDAEHLPHWLFAACRNTVANERRRAWWRKWIPGLQLDGWPSTLRTDLALEEEQLATRVAAALDTLGADHREVLVLCYLEERSVAETADLLGIPAGTVKSRLFHARARFERAYGEEP